MKISKESVSPLDFDGLSIIDYTADNNFSASIAEISVLPGVKHKISWSKRSDKFFYIVSGRLQFTLDSEEFELVAGDTCIVKRGQKFSYFNFSSEVSKIILFHTPSFDLSSEVFED